MATNPLLDPASIDAILDPKPLLLENSAPVFVVGCVGSGMQALAEALREGAQLPGAAETHVPSLMQRMLDEIHRQYASLSEEYLAEKDGNLIANTSEEAVTHSVSNYFSRFFEDQIPQGLSVEVIPEVERRVPAIRSCLTLSRLFPQARFVFVVRRPIDLLLSLMAEKPNPPIQHWCWIWKNTLETWAKIRDILGERRLEVHHHEMATQPEGVAKALGAFLGLEDGARKGIATRLEQAFQGPNGDPAPFRFTGIEETPWKPWQRKLFLDLCLTMLQGAGYDLDPKEFR